MANHYIKNCKYSGSKNFLTDQYNLVTGFWGKQIDSVLAPAETKPSGSPIKTGTDGWADYFWDTDKKLISYVKKSGGNKVTVKSPESAYTHLTKNIKWVDSTPSAMSAQKSKPEPVSTAIVPASSAPWDEVSSDKGFLGKSIDYAKENPLIVGGTAAGVLGLIAGLMLLRSSPQQQAMLPVGSGSFDEEKTYYYYVVGPDSHMLRKVDVKSVTKRDDEVQFDDIGKRLFLTGEEAYRAGMNYLFGGNNG